MAKGCGGMKSGSMLKKYAGGGVTKKFAGGGAVESSAKANSSWGDSGKLDRMNKNVTKMAKGGKVKNCK
jgi:hypothetical protein